ncbi:hypothetical protein OO014_06945 [Intrasporangium calvum]|uniref:Uncharacterized protein n=1 Tax=Intrasporangium calvum TaxID=53358 RepID=A0ABT5GFV0_9MICO|nr:hypothetical protein [Intrasporangium calvum]MDC5696992.1 hypothetical protein [Intrasporangium calvum]
MYELLARMQGATREDAEHLRLKLEADYAPNQVLREGAAELATGIIAGLAGASTSGRLESWELLAVLAAGAVPPTAADPDVVAAAQGALIEAVPFVSARVASPQSKESDYLAVDVLDAVSVFGKGAVRSQIIRALRAFAERGEREAARVQVVLEGLGPDPGS